MTVLVLGAGASKSYGASPSGQRMPIARDFFPTFDQLKIASNPWVLVGNILEFAERYRGLSATDFFHRDIDIEEFHSEVEAKFLECLRSPGSVAPVNAAWKAYTELLFVFAATLNEIQNGLPSQTHLRLAKEINQDDVIVTFNWDTLMDRALAEATEWKVDSGYGIVPRKVYRDEWQEPNSVATRATPILKLHGSSNWLTSAPFIDPRSKAITPTQVSSPETLYVFEYATKPYSCYDGRYMDGYQPFSYGYYPPNILDDEGKQLADGHVLVKVMPRFPGVPKGMASSNGLTSMPLIIPPVKDKRYDYFGSLFSRVWSSAEEALSRADRIVIVGYSFPRTDHRSVKLFRDAFMRRKTMPQIRILDPRPELIAERFQREFGIPKSHVTTFADYFSESFDLSRLLS